MRTVRPGDPHHKRHQILQTALAARAQQNQVWDKWLAWYLGDDPIGTNAGGQDPSRADMGGVGEDYRIDTNFPFAFIDTMVANICPANPQVTLRAMNSKDEEPARAREALVNSSLRRDKFAKTLRKLVAFTSLFGVGFLKTTWNIPRRRPVTRALNPRVVFWDPTVPFEDTRYVIEAVPLTREEFEQRVTQKKWRKANPTFNQIPSWLVDPYSQNTAYTMQSLNIFEWVVVYEYHDFVEGTVSWYLDDSPEPLYSEKAPYTFVRNPYTKLTFNENLYNEEGVSDIKLIEKLQERLNEVDALELWHAFASIPFMIINENAVDDITMAKRALANIDGPGSLVGLKVNGALPLQGAVTFSVPPQNIPAFKEMRSRILDGIRFVLAITDYQRGKMGDADLATEIAAADNAIRTRNGTRIELVEDVVVEVTGKTLGLWRQFFPEAGSLSVAGRDEFTIETVDRLTLAFDGSPDSELGFGDEWAYEYEVAPFSPSENTKLIQLRNIAQFLEALMSAPNLDKDAIFSELARLLNLDKAIRPPGSTPPGPPVAGQPGVEGMPGMPGGNGGNLPPGMEEMHQAGMLQAQPAPLTSPPRLG